MLVLGRKICYFDNFFTLSNVKTCYKLHISRAKIKRKKKIERERKRKRENISILQSLFLWLLFVLNLDWFSYLYLTMITSKMAILKWLTICWLLLFVRFLLMLINYRSSWLFVFFFFNHIFFPCEIGGAVTFNRKHQKYSNSEQISINILPCPIFSSKLSRWRKLDIFLVANTL